MVADAHPDGFPGALPPRVADALLRDARPRRFGPRNGSGELDARGMKVHDATFSADESGLLTAAHDQTPRIWDVATARVPLEEVTTGGARTYECIVCRPVEELVALARERITRSLAPEEWATYLGQNT